MNFSSYTLTKVHLRYESTLTLLHPVPGEGTTTEGLYPPNIVPYTSKNTQKKIQLLYFNEGLAGPGF